MDESHLAGLGEQIASEVCHTLIEGLHNGE